MDLAKKAAKVESAKTSYHRILNEYHRKRVCVGSWQGPMIFFPLAPPDASLASFGMWCHLLQSTALTCCSQGKGMKPILTEELVLLKEEVLHGLGLQEEHHIWAMQEIYRSWWCPMHHAVGLVAEIAEGTCSVCAPKAAHFLKTLRAGHPGFYPERMTELK
jgi:hypothetical protein